MFEFTHGLHVNRDIWASAFEFIAVPLFEHRALHRKLCPFCVGKFDVTERKQQGGVERATRSELRRLGCSVQSDSMPALAVSLARQIDTARGAVAAAAAAGQLRLILADLERSAVRPEKDAIDELNARRAVRRSASG